VPATASVPGGDIAGTVTDSASGQPLAGAEVNVTQNGQTVVRVLTDPFGRYLVHNLAAGTYEVTVRFFGFGAITHTVTIGPNSGTTVLSANLPPVPTTLAAIQVVGATPIAVDTRTGDQVYKENDYHGSPITTTSQILQQSIASSARAPTGEVHIRGQHAEYTYYVDGVPVPSGVSGSLNELFDPQVVNKIDFQTGGWDAEYGGKNIAIVNIQTRIPSGGFHGTLTGYDGSFNSNGQSLAASTNSGKFGFFVSGTRQVTDMRREPVMFDTLTDVPMNFHNYGRDEFGFGKIQYTPSGNDLMTLEVNESQTHFLVPFDSSGGVRLDDHQADVNSFVNYGYRHLFGKGAVTDESAPAELFVGAFYRHGSLGYVPGASDAPSLTYGTDTTTKYNVSEDRSFNTYGLKLDYSVRALPQLTLKFGTLMSVTTGHENFQLSDPTGSHPSIQSISGLDGHDVSVFAQAGVTLGEHFEIRPGVRYDSHVAPFAGNQDQLSPRLRLNFFPDPANTLYAYYGRLFVPTNIEDLRSITASAQGNQATTPTLPERDDYYEAGYIHRFPVGVVTKLSGYYKRSAPGIDDNTVPGSSITTSVNLHDVRVTGLEAVFEVRPRGPISGYVNASIIHAYGDPPVYGGFFFLAQPNNSFFDLDHDQRVSVVAGLTYARGALFVSTTGIFGSGLTNGITPDSSVTRDTVGQPAISHYCTGLFCMNKPFKVAPNYIQHVSVGYSFTWGASVIRPELFVDNVFNSRYLLKGAFFSGASVGRPRTVQFRMNVGM
jgi:Carboxypeptidase regulatory-like domain